jgi:hypothetical protein
MYGILSDLNLKPLVHSRFLSKLAVTELRARLTRLLKDKTRRTDNNTLIILSKCHFNEFYDKNLLWTKGNDKLAVTELRAKIKELTKVYYNISMKLTEVI